MYDPPNRLTDPQFVGVAFPRPLRDRLDRVAEQDGVSRSEAVRAAVRLFLDVKGSAANGNRDD